MNYYIELTIIPNAEIPIYDVWSKLYTQFHLALVDYKDNDNQVSIGVSFPQYKAEKMSGKLVCCLGSKLRVFANSIQELEQLNLGKWLDRLTDYVHVKSPQQVKTVSQYLTVNRYRPKPKIEKVADRFAAFKKISYEEALSHCKEHKKQREDYPYIQMKSLSGGREFSLCINQQIVKQPVVGKFSTYGLSAVTTVPDW